MAGLRWDLVGFVRFVHLGWVIVGRLGDVIGSDNRGRTTVVGMVPAATARERLHWLSRPALVVYCTSGYVSAAALEAMTEAMFESQAFTRLPIDQLNYTASYAARKRRSGPGSVEHHGRVTKRTTQPPVPKPGDGGGVPMSRPRPKSTPQLSNRYTPPAHNIRFRPGWHKALGIALLLVGIAVVAMNDLMLLDFPATLCPAATTRRICSSASLPPVTASGGSDGWTGPVEPARAAEPGNVLARSDRSAHR